MLSFICCYCEITSVSLLCSAYFTAKKCDALQSSAITFLCACAASFVHPPSVRPDKKKFLCLCPLTNVVMLWVDEDSLSFQKDTRRGKARGKDASRVYVALCHLISEAAEAGWSYCALLFLKLAARTREPSMVPFLWGPRLKRLPPKKQHWRPNCE